MSAAVIQHPRAAAAPISNPRWRGRYPAHVVWLWRVREAVELQRCAVEAQLARQRLMAIEDQVNKLWHSPAGELRSALITERGRLLARLQELGHEA
jgi:hypothetical protein